MRTLFVTLLAVMLALPGAAFALDLNAARNQGLVGERADGLIGAVTKSSEADALVKSVNAERMKSYREIAAKEGTKLDAVQAIAGEKQVQKARENGWYYMDAGESWKK
jgi:uncharacterized protein YdbL (DUF1318 family)